MPSRRALLASAAAGLAALAGCSDRVDADRRVPADWSPDPGTWPCPRYDRSHTGHGDATPPTGEPTERWSLAVEGAVDAAVAAARRLFLLVGGRASGRPSTVHAVDPVSGEREWTWRFPGRTAQSLTAIDRRLYAHGTDVIALRPDGETAWRTAVDESLWLASLVELDGVVYAASNFNVGALVSLHADTGEQLWRADLDQSAVGLAGDRLCVTGHFGLSLRATERGPFEQLAGDPPGVRESWSLDRRSAVPLTPTVADGRAYLGGADPTGPPLATAFDLAAGEVRWSWTAASEETQVYNPVVLGDRVVWQVWDGDEPFDGRMVALDSGDGSVAWTFDPEPWVDDIVGASGRVYAIAGDTLTAFRADGTRLFEHTLGTAPDDPTLVPYKDAVVVAGDGRVRAFAE